MVPSLCSGRQDGAVCAKIPACSVLLQPQGGPIQGLSHRCTPPHPDTLHAGILAHTAPSCLPEQRERHHARTLCSTVGLRTVGSVVIPPPPPPFTLDTFAIGLLVFYHYYSRFPFPATHCFMNTCTSRDITEYMLLCLPVVT